ncbi:hypothetical protein V6N12_019446 [Hibiscus sabdariffa]|uniref:RNase H type-1 domain-containing protein n=1 Tax=Hibiscus sabdariffa TaxID=183260 RepID=A0ABR2BP17_9ROSI
MHGAQRGELYSRSTMRITPLFRFIVILQCLIAPTTEEIVIWEGNSSGVYTTRTGYNWLLKREAVLSEPNKIWNQIAKLHTLPKVRIFAWRACHDAFPTRSRLLDIDGLIMAACTYPNPFVSHSEMAEALACFQATSLAIDLGFRRVIMERDALTVIIKTNSKSEDRSDIGSIISNIKNKIEEFEQITFMHVSRRLNNTTHVLA